MSTTVCLLNEPCNTTTVDLESLRRLDGLYAFYDEHWWCKLQMFTYFKKRNAILNGLALLTMATSIVVGSVWAHGYVAMLEHADVDQINAISEMLLNLLKKRIPVDTATYGKLKRRKNVLREVGKRRNSVKRRRQHLLNQKGSGFWSGLHGCFRACWAR